MKNLSEILLKHSLWLKNDPQGERADLRCADLSDADLSGADLSDADLSGADLRCADLRRANLRCADLSGADLRCANLRRANLRCADLSGADLRCADLSGANLSGADLIIYQSGKYRAFIQSQNTRIGCKYYTNEEWKTFTDEQISIMAGDALEWWNDNKEIIFSIMDKLESKVKK